LFSPYPSNNPKAPPLSFDLDVVDSMPPTPDQLKTILTYIPSKGPPPSLSIFTSSPTLQNSLTSADAVSQLAASDPKAFKWPVVVDWTGGRASVGDVDGVNGILETIRQQRDGETRGDDIDQPQGWLS
jgi:hypothetical protein